MNMRRGRPVQAGAWRVWASIVICLATTSLVAAQAKHKKSAKTKTDPKPMISEVAPFRVGEQLDFRVSWTTFTSAATIRLAVAERRDLHGWDTWHLRATAHTENPARILYTMDDQFDSYSDTGSLASRQYEMHIREQGKQQDTILRFLPRGTAASDGESSVIVLPGTRDPISMVYFLRQVDWQHTPSISAPVYDGRKFYDLHAQLASAREMVTVPSGTYPVSRISVQAFDYGQSTPTAEFSLWLAQDALRTPVRMEAELPFGSIRVDLTSANK